MLNFEDIQYIIENYNVIVSNREADSAKFVLKNGGNKSIPVKAIAEHINCYQKSAKKFPQLREKNLVFTEITYQQSSGEAAASYKASLFEGKKLLDMTGGMGVDSFFFSKNFDEVHYCEIDEIKTLLAQYNFSVLNAENITVINKDSVEYLLNNNETYSVIYADPSRREADKRSVDVGFYQPNIPGNYDKILTKCDVLMVKLAPAFDFEEAKRVFPNMYEYIVVSVRGENKEVLILNKAAYSGEITKRAVMLEYNGTVIHNICSDKNESHTFFSGKEIKYIFEPDASVIKGGLTPNIAYEYKLNFLDENVVFLTGDELQNNFPGKCYEVIEALPSGIKNIKSELKKRKLKKVNVAARNYGEKANVIVDKLGVKEGGEHQLIFTTLKGNKIVLLTKRVKS